MNRIWIVYVGTVAWITPLVFALVAPSFLGIRAFPYLIYIRLVWLAAAIMGALILIGIFRAARFSSNVRSGCEPRQWHEIPFFLWLVIFWAFFPPSQSFVEVYSYNSGFLALPNGVSNPVEKSNFFETVKAYSDLSSKIWAAAGTVLGALLTLGSKPPAK